MTEEPSIQCPSCGYDLGAVTTDTERCPECGDTFSKSAVRESRRSVLCHALLMMSLGGFGVLFSAIATSLVSSYYVRYLDVVPMFAAVYGVSVASNVSGLTPMQRWWPIVIGGFLILCLLINLGASTQGEYSEYSRWLQPPAWGDLAGRAGAVAELLLPMAGGLVLSRAALCMGNRLIRRSAIFVVTASGVSLLMYFAKAIQSMYLAPNGSAFGTPPAPFVASAAFAQCLEFFYTVAWWLTWSALTFVAIHIRAFRSTSR